MDYAEGVEREPDYLTDRMLVLNFAAIHTSTMVFDRDDMTNCRCIYMRYTILPHTQNIRPFSATKSNQCLAKKDGPDQQS